MEKELEMTPEALIIHCDDLDEAIEEQKRHGFRLDMIFPADSPREALMSRGEESVRVLSEPPASAGGREPESYPTSLSPHALVTLELVPPANADGSDFVRGRAGMEYRDLIPGRLGGKVIASHIRLPFGGEVPDSVHYHKIDFQMIYCVRGRIQVVYEGQGPPFWLETGDCILQPPKIRHRVLYSEAGAEVIEVSSPAEHETLIDHEMELPTPLIDRARDYSGSRFVRHTVLKLEESGVRDTGVSAATNGRFEVKIRRDKGSDTALLLELRGLGAEGDRGLAAPIAIEIPI